MPALAVDANTSTLGPVTVGPADRLRVNELHLENDSCAVTWPDPTVTLNDRDGLDGLSEPEKVWVRVDAAGVGAGEGDELGEVEGLGDGDGTGLEDGEGVGDADGVEPPAGAD